MPKKIIKKSAIKMRNRKIKDKTWGLLLSDYVAQLYLNEDYSDITFCVGNERIPAHRVILASREYFRTLLFGFFAENKQDEIVLQVQVTPFKALLKYIYNEFILLEEIEFDECIGILRLSHMYGFNDLTNAIECHLERGMSMEKVPVLLEVSQQLCLDSLSKSCLKFLDDNASTFLLHESFTNLSQVNFIFKSIPVKIHVFVYVFDDLVTYICVI